METDDTLSRAPLASSHRKSARGWCASVLQLRGTSGAVEDLAQETLLEAWRHLKGLRDPQKRFQWLTGIARNVCRRWRRQRGRDLARHVPLEAPPEQEGVLPEEAFADLFDIDVELERKELIALLDRAM